MSPSKDQDDALMEFLPTALPDVKIIVPKKFGDQRGFFSEVFRKDAFAKAGIDCEFVQDNHSLSATPGVVRGLHWQVGASAQHKLGRVLRGAILDVAVDLRRHSPTFGRHVSVELSADNWRQLFVPIGFAHGFVTRTPDVEVVYKVTSYYSPADERGLRWNDPELGIDWGIREADATLSDRDRNHPRLADLPIDWLF
jgi:dTDP-4-dehydrorhamnose 3,5-epimerase